MAVRKAATKRAARKKARRQAPAPAADRASAEWKGSPAANRGLAKLRKILAAWPETDERLSHGSPTFWGGKKTFATIADDHHGDGRVAIWAKATFELQSDLVEADPDLFFVPQYVGPSGWVGIRIDRKIDWKVVEEILEQGYRSVAPKRAIAQLDG